MPSVAPPARPLLLLQHLRDRARTLDGELLYFLHLARRELVQERRDLSQILRLEERLEVVVGDADVPLHERLVRGEELDDLVELRRLAVEGREAEERERIARRAFDRLLREADRLVALRFVVRIEPLKSNVRRRRLGVDRRVRHLFEHRYALLFALLLLQRVGEVGPGVDRVLLDLDRTLGAFALGLLVPLRLHHAGEVERRERALLHHVLRALQRRFGLVDLLLLELRDAEREPVFAVAAHRDELREDFFRLLVALVLHQLLGEDAAAAAVVRRVVPVLLEAGEQVVAADGDRATLVVLHLDGGAVEAEELPHFVHLERDRARDDLLLDGGAVRPEREEDERVARDAGRKRGNGGEDCGAAREADAGCALRGVRGGDHEFSLGKGWRTLAHGRRAGASA